MACATFFHRMMGLDDVEEPEDQQRDRARDADSEANAVAAGHEPSRWSPAPAHEPDPPRPCSRNGELPGLEREGNLLVAQDAVVRVQLASPSSTCRRSGPAPIQRAARPTAAIRSVRRRASDRCSRPPAHAAPTSTASAGNAGARSTRA